jgi:predicted DNA-binding transcriptional regulator YafY
MEKALTGLSSKPAFELLDLIDTKKLNPKNLHRPERQNIVDTLRAEGWGQARIANLLKCSHRTIRRDIRVLRDQQLPKLKEFTRERVAAETIAIADGLRQKAIAKGDLSLAWQITKELPTVVQSLGLLHKEPDELKLSGLVEVAKQIRDSVPQERLDDLISGLRNGSNGINN